MKHYFAVETKCGHVGKDRCIYIWFAVKAESKKDAAVKAREYKRVKHHHKDAIREVREISFEEFLILRRSNFIDPYLQCKNIQQQRELEHFEERVEVDEYLLSKKNKPALNRDATYILKKNKILARDAIRQILEDYYEEIVV